jgi:hypothetical protein
MFFDNPLIQWDPIIRLVDDESLVSFFHGAFGERRNFDSQHLESFRSGYI